ncbi:MAG: hypothetical protein V1884_01655 [Candidatus Omnitrophota bacterium]
MRNAILNITLLLLILLVTSCLPVRQAGALLVTDSFAEEESYTITTYYPSPYGSYNELSTYSNTYLAISSGNVGIGKSNPTAKLEVAGEIKLSGAAPSYKITNVATPTANNDVATKAYVDAATGGNSYVYYTEYCVGGNSWEATSCAARCACAPGYTLDAKSVPYGLYSGKSCTQIGSGCFCVCYK